MLRACPGLGKLHGQPCGIAVVPGRACYCVLHSLLCAAPQDLEQFNDFFIEKEEECIIRTQDLKEQLARAQGDSRSLARVRSAFVDLHGERLQSDPL